MHAATCTLASPAKHSKALLQRSKGLCPSSSLSAATLTSRLPMKPELPASPKTRSSLLSIAEVEKTIDQVQEVNSGFLYTAQSIFQIVVDALKPGVHVAAPLLQKAGEQAIKIASPALSEASKKAQEAMQSSGIDMRSLS